MFKNETHNHPTEIEPFGGAATCMGGAIRDPLSGRGYVYQAMRVTGAAIPCTPRGRDAWRASCPSASWPRPPPQAIPPTATRSALPPAMVSRALSPRLCGQASGDRRGRRRGSGRQRGAGGARPRRCGHPAGRPHRPRRHAAAPPAPPRAHTKKSLETCGAEVQKGNAPEERKIQRLFRNGRRDPADQALQRLRRGRRVSVAIGELADGLVH